MIAIGSLSLMRVALGVFIIVVVVASPACTCGECVDCLDLAGPVDTADCCPAISPIMNGGTGQLVWLDRATVNAQLGEPLHGSLLGEDAIDATVGLVETLTPSRAGIRLADDLEAGTYDVGGVGFVVVGTPREFLSVDSALALRAEISTRTVCRSTCDAHPGKPLPTESYKAATVTFDLTDPQRDVVALNVWIGESLEEVLGADLEAGRPIDMLPLEEAGFTGPEVDLAGNFVRFRMPQGGKVIKAQLIELATGLVGTPPAAEIP